MQPLLVFAFSDEGKAGVLALTSGEMTLNIA
jgi:hypothetical protein